MAHMYIPDVCTHIDRSIQSTCLHAPNASKFSRVKAACFACIPNVLWLSTGQSSPSLLKPAHPVTHEPPNPEPFRSVIIVEYTFTVFGFLSSVVLIMGSANGTSRP